jgi:hypothetical protein
MVTREASARVTMPRALGAGKCQAIGVLVVKSVESFWQVAALVAAVILFVLAACGIFAI